MALLTRAAVCAGMLWSWHTFCDRQHRPAAGRFLRSSPPRAGLLLTVAMVWLPWSIARIAAAQFLYRTWPLWSMFGRIAHAAGVDATALDALLHRIAGRKHAAADEESIEEEIRTIVSEGHREGLLEEEAREMIEGVIELGDAVVSHIMTPRTEINMIPVEHALG